MYIYNVSWKANTAGPSPHDNERTELFLLGCQKAAQGNPCAGCFNSQTWYVDKDKAIFQTPYQVAEQLLKYMPNKYLTIGGGEPLDQIKELIVLCEILKSHGIHIIIYTWRYIKAILSKQYGASFYDDFIALSKYADVFIDGPYKKEKCTYRRDTADGFLNSIGSSNQHIILVKDGRFTQYELENVRTFNYKEAIFVDGLEEILNECDNTR